MPALTDRIVALRRALFEGATRVVVRTLTGVQRSWDTSCFDDHGRGAGPA
jgi:hypothetical protein